MSDVAISSEQSLVPTATPSAQPGSMLGLLAEVARDKSIDTSKLQAFLNMQIQLEDRQAERAYNQALGRISKQLPRIPKNGRIELGAGKGSIPFAKWEEMDKLIRPILDSEGFVLSFTSEERPGGGAVVIGRLRHPDGHSETASVPLPLDTGPGRNNIQAMGSTISYGRRYAVELLLNLVREGQDDDGKSGGTRYLDDDQVQQVLDLMRETRTEMDGFLRTWDVKSIEEIEVQKFVPVMNLLSAKKAQQVKRAQP
jgi:hypothetical protein